MTKERYVKLPSELVDGQHWTPINNPLDIGDAICRWLMDGSIGDKVTLEIVELTDDEIERLPSI